MKSQNNSNHWTSATKATPFALLPPRDQEFIRLFSQEKHLSHQSIRKLITIARDLDQWQEASISDWLSKTILERKPGKALLLYIEAKYKNLRSSEKSYKNFSIVQLNTSTTKTPKVNKIIEIPKSDRILGPCPVASPKTRCCNLLTLDMVRNCPAQCSYCAIQSFFHSNALMIETHLTQKLKQWVSSPEYNPDKIYHIGTGQSSDSIKLADRGGILDELFGFIRKYPNIILELKTKSENIDSVIALKPPPNVFCTWSLNPPVIISNEEHRTASLEGRLTAARRAADAGVKVGFHFHPMILFSGWQREYQDIAYTIQNSFKPSEVLCVSLGTLTFIRSLLPRIRMLHVNTKVLQMPLTETSGKLSYPVEIKRELFSVLYQAFKRWHQLSGEDKVFFYICMESSKLWKDVFGFEYSSNDEFEKNMISCYSKKLRRLT